MKTSNSNTKAQILRSTFYLLLLLAICAMPFALAKRSFDGLTTSATQSKQTGILSFAERVAYQRGIEDVYWRHRIWPRSRGEQSGPKPALEKIMSQTRIEAKVGEYLRNSQMLAEYWHRPITPEQLQAEMERMARNTKQPEVLRELFQALGNDPFVIAECLARPVLTEALFAELSDHDKGQRVALLRTTEVYVFGFTARHDKSPDCRCAHRKLSAITGMLSATGMTVRSRPKSAHKGQLGQGLGRRNPPTEGI